MERKNLKPFLVDCAFGIIDCYLPLPKVYGCMGRGRRAGHKKYMRHFFLGQAAYGPLDQLLLLSKIDLHMVTCFVCALRWDPQLVDYGVMLWWGRFHDFFPSRFSHDCGRWSNKIKNDLIYFLLYLFFLGWDI